SKTNTVVEDVDEDDLFKTDGDYIYQVDESDINIYKAEDKKTKKIKTLDLSKYTDYNIKGMYLFKNKLVVLTTYYDVLPYTSCKCKYCTKINKQSYTTVLIYDVKNPKEAKLKTKFIQSGYYNSSRMIDDTLYLSSTYTPDIYSKNKIKKKEKSRYLPIFYDGKNYHYQNSGCINLSDKLDKTSYSIIASYSIDYNLKIDDKSFFGYADLKFVSNNNAYFTEESYRYYNKEQFTNKTKITKFSIDNGAIKFVASKKIEGGILNSFSMDEKDGYLRLVTTQQKDKSYNHLFVLDKNLHKVGSVENLAKNERIYSARFLGDYAYFVTYRNTDPLFCADLSNPQEPKIVSELKIPGFSNYLHPFGKNKIFGLGETDGGNTKIAMYDISNKEKIKEIVTKKLGANYSDASYDHHAIMVDEKKNLIAFPVDTFNYNYDDYDDYDYEDLSYYEDVSYYYIFKFSNNKFKLKARIKLDDIYKFRGLYIDDYFYISDSGHLRIVSLKTFKQVKKV
ncbi:MAG: beta-propeller domain-containing protein, partial [Clostridia bacterium]|nr:beta-propeller domain-containing protein [Clostridia bacterium]